MTDLEIMAQLKTAYESITDITENADNTQIHNNEELKKVCEILESEYRNIYKYLNKTNKEILKYKKNIYISCEIYHDYELNDGTFITKGDLDELCWWKDTEYLWYFVTED